MKTTFTAATYCNAKLQDAVSTQDFLQLINAKRVTPLRGVMTQATGFRPLLDTPSEDAYNRIGDLIAFELVVLTRKPSDRVVMLYCDNQKRKAGLGGIGEKDDFYNLHHAEIVEKLLESTLTKTTKVPVVINFNTGLALVGTASSASFISLNKLLAKHVLFSRKIPDENENSLTELIGQEPKSVSATIETTYNITMQSADGAKARWANQDLMKKEILDAVEGGKRVTSIGLSRDCYDFTLMATGAINKIKKRAVKNDEQIEQQDAAQAPVEMQPVGTMLASDVLEEVGVLMDTFAEIHAYLMAEST